MKNREETDAECITIPLSDLKVHALSMVGIFVNSWSNLETEAYSSSVSPIADSNA